MDISKFYKSSNSLTHSVHENTPPSILISKMKQMDKVDGTDAKNLADQNGVANMDTVNSTSKYS
jgi:hypothetical protein